MVRVEGSIPNRANLFQMKEKYGGTIDVGRINAASMKLVLDYFYSGEIGIDTKNVCDLLDAAEYLQVDGKLDFVF